MGGQDGGGLDEMIMSRTERGWPVQDDSGRHRTMVGDHEVEEQIGHTMGCRSRATTLLPSFPGLSTSASFMSNGKFSSFKEGM